MTCSQYKNIIKWTLANSTPDDAADSVATARAIFKNCGVAFPNGNIMDILLTLMSEKYMGWMSCTCAQAQEFANTGVATVGVDADHIVVVAPEEKVIITDNAIAVTDSVDDFIQPASSIEPVDRMQMQFFAYASGSTTTHESPQYPLISAYCSWTLHGSSTWSWSEDMDGDLNHNERDWHLGNDLKGSSNNVYPTLRGTVKVAENTISGANGRVVIIEHDFQGKTIYSLYAHLSAINVSVGDLVYQNTTIGVMGGSGYGSETYYHPHLHFAITNSQPTAGFWGYDTYFSGNLHLMSGITFYNPRYIITYNSIPTA